MAVTRRAPSHPLVGRRMSLEEFERLPEVKPYLELREGVVTQKVAPQETHGFLEYGLADLVNTFGRPRKLAFAIPELRCYIGASYLVPDLAIYRWDRLKRRPDGRITDVYAGPPDAVVEIRSPDQTISDLDAKCRLYLANGVPLVLLIHPAQEWVRVYRADGTVATLRGDERIDLDSILPGLDLTVRKVFDTLLG
jgi:Uma2 family endonuclease